MKTTNLNEEIMVVEAHGLNQRGMIQCKNYDVYPEELDTVADLLQLTNKLNNASYKINENFITIKNSAYYLKFKKLNREYVG